ncbi:hypothetical protein [Hyphomonas sp.]|uniref:hypothetical protein n=1 Tax=Hyphomonas sp. TaxID=87 RepID=UPI00391C8C30
MPRRRERGPWFWRGAIALMMTSVFGLFAAAAMNQPPATDNVSGCRLDRQDPAHTIILVDQSDPFIETDHDWVRALVSDEARALPKYGRLTLAVPNSALAHDPKTIISVCSPGSADGANPIFQNPRMIEQAWRTRFQAPAMAGADTILLDTVAPSSPLLEAVFTLSARPDFQAGTPARRMILVSDLMQHSRDFSMYRTGTDYEPFEASPLNALRPRLDGVEVAARIVPRPEYPLPLVEVKAFWERWLTEAGTAGFASVN